MKNRIALVTGGTGGIGTAICQALTASGARVAAGYNKGGNHELARAWQLAQKKAGFDIAIFYGDVGDFEGVGLMVERITQDMGPIDILVNNAGITRDMTFKKMDLPTWQTVIHTNLDSLFNITRQVINGMLEREYGRIINISSINGQKGQFGQTHYSAAKAGIHGFSKALAQEVARKGITVNTISPGYIETDMMTSIPPAVLAEIKTQIPVGRLGHPDEVARAVLFLAAEASAFITGANLCINGGQHMF
jgi:acetoacetyl-CoA reductase